MIYTLEQLRAMDETMLLAVWARITKPIWPHVEIEQAADACLAEVERLGLRKSFCEWMVSILRLDFIDDPTTRNWKLITRSPRSIIEAAILTCQEESKDEHQ